jgi:hypothetical protein
MENTKGFVIAFHNNDEENRYHGLTCKDRAIRKLKPYIPYDILSKFRQVDSKVEFDKVRSRISLESGIAQKDGEVLAFIERKVKDGESIFLDLTEEDALRHNGSELTSLFFIASVYVTQEHFALMNPGPYTANEREEIARIVEESQDGVLTEMLEEPSGVL